MRNLKYSAVAFLAVSCWFGGKCSRQSAPEPATPPAAVVTTEDAARESFSDYAKALAEEHHATAAMLRSGTYKTYQEAREGNATRTKLAREKAFQKLVDAMNERLKGPQDLPKAANEYDSAAKGFSQ